MINNELKKLGISNPNRIYYNLSYKELFKYETNPKLNNKERGIVTKTGAVNIDTGRFTGRSKPGDQAGLYQSRTGIHRGRGTCYLRNETGLRIWQHIGGIDGLYFETLFLEAGVFIVA